MHDGRERLFLLVNVIGGVAVLGSYAWGIAAHWGDADILWGGIDGWMRRLYTVNMLPATIGYLMMFYFVLRRIDAAPHWRSIITWYVIFLSGASLWMPLTFAAIDGGGPSFFGWIQAVLAVAGVGSVAIWVHVWRIDAPSGFKPVALGTGTFLVLQCAILDALIWPRYFEIPQ